MSPLAVSQYLPQGPTAQDTVTFDTVIFDEASQIFPEDAVPAILRARQVILAGDEKQLPPTRFFQNSLDQDDSPADEEEEVSTDTLEGMESILNVAVSQTSLFDEAHLRVHYRSRDENLIRFSNKHFYGDRPLITFPAPGGSDSFMGVHDVYLPDGRYDRGGTRTNRIEAEKVVDIVFEHFRSRPNDESVGVVALSRVQSDFIEELIEIRRLEEHDANRRFDSGIVEPFFVKNLENVQGDERDHIILCIGYGPSSSAEAVFQNFGPIIQQEGQRRLNVAISRARKRMTVVHSLHPSKIVPQTEGARLLKRYLEFVSNPATLGIDTASNPDAGTESPFEESVRRALEARGHLVTSQVGVSRYRIDLAIRREEGDGFDLGIECDGATYHSSPAARDRDWLRQRVLEDLGWHIHRVWSTSWVQNREREIERIESALAVARARPSQTVDTSPVELAEDLPDPEDSPPGEPESHEPEHVDVDQDDGFDTYVEASLDDIRVGQELSYETYGNFLAVLKRVAEVEGPVHEEVLLDRVRSRYGISRVGSNRRDEVNRHIRRAKNSGEITHKAGFMWIDDEQLDRRPRTPSSPDSVRSVSQIHLEELKAAILATAKLMYGGDKDAIITQTARQLGYRSTRLTIVTRLKQAYDQAGLDAGA